MRRPTDLVHRDGGGRLEFLGRIDHQVEVRGRVAFRRFTIAARRGRYESR